MNKEQLKSLGQKVTYTEKYDPSQLEGFSRESRRDGYVQMNGADVWTAFEVSFLKPNGLPCYLVLRLSNPVNSKKIFESKSLKLYLNSFNNSVIESEEALISIIKNDLSTLVDGDVLVEKQTGFNHEIVLTSGCNQIEDFVQDIDISEYNYNPLLLEVKSKREDKLVRLTSNLGRSNCEITNAPDFFRLFVIYEPNKLEVTYESLLQYIVSLRGHQMFHEPVTERIWQDLYKLLEPKSLTVVCQFTRRGGIDINPIRTTEPGFYNVKKWGDSIVKLPKLTQQ